MAADSVIPLVDLRAGIDSIRDEVMCEIAKTFDGAEFFLGPNVRAFETEFADYLGASHGVGVSSGTDALAAALSALEVGPGDEVILPSHTFFATVEAVLRVGAVPVFVDVEEDSLTIDPTAVAAAISEKTRAVIPVHLYGQPAEMAPLLRLRTDHGLRIIEDAAQAHGARYNGQSCGSIGDAGCFSFYFTKNLAALGEGGFVSCRDEETDARLRLLRNHGRVSKTEHAILGSNLRLDEIQASVLRIRLRRLEAANERRRAIAARYDAALSGAPVRVLPHRSDRVAVYHLYPIRVRHRDRLQAELATRGLETGIHYPVPAHKQPALLAHEHRCVGRLPVTETACRQLLSLPMYPELTDEQVERVAKAVLDCIEEGA